MEENPITKQLEELASSLRKYNHEIIIRNQDWILESKVKKARLLIIFIALVLGILHLSQQKVIMGLLDFMFAITFMIMAYFTNKKYELLKSDIDHLLIAPDGITVYFKNKNSVQFASDEIESLQVNVQYNGNNTIASIILFHSNGVKYKMASLMSKNEIAVTSTAEKVLEMIKSTVLLKA
jgi:hypothetical protein